MQSFRPACFRLVQEVLFDIFGRLGCGPSVPVAKLEEAGGVDVFSVKQGEVGVHEVAEVGDSVRFAMLEVGFVDASDLGEAEAAGRLRVKLDHRAGCVGVDPGRGDKLSVEQTPLFGESVCCGWTGRPAHLTLKCSMQRC